MFGTFNGNRQIKVYIVFRVRSDRLYGFRIHRIKQIPSLFPEVPTHTGVTFPRPPFDTFINLREQFLANPFVTIPCPTFHGLIHF